jgi:hypothetical protein
MRCRLQICQLTTAYDLAETLCTRFSLSWNPHVGEQIKEIDEEQDRDERR